MNDAPGKRNEMARANAYDDLRDETEESSAGGGGHDRLHRGEDALGRFLRWAASLELHSHPHAENAGFNETILGTASGPHPKRHSAFGVTEGSEERPLSPSLDMEPIRQFGITPENKKEGGACNGKSVRAKEVRQP